MKKIRIGNDFTFMWAIERGGQPESFEQAESVRLVLTSLRDRWEITDYRIVGNKVIIDFTPDILRASGRYAIQLFYTLPSDVYSDSDRRCAVDTDAFEIVPRTAQATYEGEEVAVTSDVKVGIIEDVSTGFLHGMTSVFKSTYDWNVNDSARSAAIVGNKICFLDKQNTRLHFISMVDGRELSTIYNPFFSGFSVTADNAGNLFVTSGAFGMTNNIQGTLIIGNEYIRINATPTSGTERIDYLSAWGDFATKGYLAGASVNGADVISIWEIRDGAFVDISNPIRLVGLRTGGAAPAADVFWISENRLLVSGQSRVPQVVDIDCETPSNSTSLGIKIPLTPVGGSCFFQLYDQYFIADATTVGGQIKIHSVSADFSTTSDLLATYPLGLKANSSSHLGVDCFVEKNRAYIVVLAPNNGLAYYEFRTGK